jgi:ATP sulfurylase
METINIKFIKSGDFSIGMNNKLITFVDDKVILFKHNNDVSTLNVEKCYNLNNRDSFINFIKTISEQS